MLFLIVAVILLAFVLGSVAYLPWPLTLALSVVIVVWLSVFTVRERRRRSAAGRS